MRIWGRLAPTAIDSSRKNISNHSIQQLVRLCGSPPAEVEPMQNALADLMPLFVDQNGCHCLSAALASLAARDSQFIFDCACENALLISRDRFGCAILQRCLDSGSPEQQNSLAEAICAHARDLAADTQGNYIIQHVLAMTSEGAEAVIAALSGSFFQLSTHKFASNVK